MNFFPRNIYNCIADDGISCRDIAPIRVTDFIDGSRGSRPYYPGKFQREYTLSWNKLPDAEYRELMDFVRDNCGEHFIFETNDDLYAECVFKSDSFSFSGVANDPNGGMLWKGSISFLGIAFDDANGGEPVPYETGVTVDFGHGDVRNYIAYDISDIGPSYIDDVSITCMHYGTVEGDDYENGKVGTLVSYNGGKLQGISLNGASVSAIGTNVQTANPANRNEFKDCDSSFSECVFECGSYIEYRNGRPVCFEATSGRIVFNGGSVSISDCSFRTPNFTLLMNGVDNLSVQNSRVNFLVLENTDFDALSGTVGGNITVGNGSDMNFCAYAQSITVANGGNLVIGTPSLGATGRLRAVTVESGGSCTIRTGSLPSVETLNCYGGTIVVQPNAFWVKRANFRDCSLNTSPSFLDRIYAEESITYSNCPFQRSFSVMENASYGDISLESNGRTLFVRGTAKDLKAASGNSYISIVCYGNAVLENVRTDGGELRITHVTNSFDMRAEKFTGITIGSGRIQFAKENRNIYVGGGVTVYASGFTRGCSISSQAVTTIELSRNSDMELYIGEDMVSVNGGSIDTQDAIVVGGGNAISGLSILEGGSAVGVTVNSGGNVKVSNGGVLRDAVFNTGANLDIDDGISDSVITGVTLYPGASICGFPLVGNLTVQITDYPNQKIEIVSSGPIASGSPNLLLSGRNLKLDACNKIDRALDIRNSELEMSLYDGSTDLLIVKLSSIEGGVIHGYFGAECVYNSARIKMTSGAIPLTVYHCGIHSTDSFDGIFVEKDQSQEMIQFENCRIYCKVMGSSHHGDDANMEHLAYIGCVFDLITGESVSSIFFDGKQKLTGCEFKSGCDVSTNGHTRAVNVTFRAGSSLNGVTFAEDTVKNGDI